jgi:hypothetical protein
MKFPVWHVAALALRKQLDQRRHPMNVRYLSPAGLCEAPQAPTHRARTTVQGSFVQVANFEFTQLDNSSSSLDAFGSRNKSGRSPQFCRFCKTVHLGAWMTGV